MSVSIDELWSNILKDNSSNNASLKNKRVVLLGDNLSGRKTLITKLRGDEKETHRGHGLGYDYINVTGKDDEEFGCLTIFTIDPSAPMRAQLKAALPTKESLQESIIIITVDLSRPWSVIKSLELWIGEIKAHRDEWIRLSAADRNQMDEDLQNKWLKAAQCEEVNDSTLNESLGIEIIVAALKSDSLQTILNDEGMKEAHADYLQFLLRQQCLKLGSALLYCSVKEIRTIETLKAYILQTLFEIDSEILAPRGVSREALFLPLGWDTEKRINLLKEGTEFPEEIVEPKQRSVVLEHELTAEDEQQSLMKVEEILENIASRGSNPASTTLNKSRLNSSVQSPIPAQLPRPVGTSTPSSATGTPRLITPGGPAPTAANERMLADFFNQLLLKKGPGGTTPKGASPSMNPTSKSTPKS